MNSSSSTSAKQHGKVQYDHRTTKPDWLDELLGKTFFHICSSHEEGKNELNKFCITYCVSACKLCISADHKNHKFIKINRHASKGVVSLTSIERDLDCSRIQPFKLNRRSVIALDPLPLLGPSSNDDNKRCSVCMRRIADPYHYRYCSISCKLAAFSMKTNTGDPSFLSLKKVTPAEKVSRNEDPVNAANPNHVVAANPNKEMNPGRVRLAFMDQLPSGSDLGKEFRVGLPCSEI